MTKKLNIPNNNLDASSSAFYQYYFLSNYLGENFPLKLNLLENLIRKADLGFNHNMNNNVLSILLKKYPNYILNLISNNNKNPMPIPNLNKEFQNQQNRFLFDNNKTSLGSSFEFINNNYALKNQKEKGRSFRKASTHVAIAYFIHFKSVIFLNDLSYKIN